MFLKGQFRRFIISLACCFALVLTPAKSEALSMNDPLIKAVIGIAASIVAFIVVMKAMDKLCATGYVPLACIESLTGRVMVLVVITYGMSILMNSKKKSHCKGSECYKEGVATATTLEPSQTSGGSTTGGTTGGLAGLNDSSPVQGLTPEGVLETAGINLEQEKINAERGLADLNSKGYSFDAKTNTITTPNGKINAASMGSASGMSASGFSAKDIKAFEAARDDAKDAADKAQADLLKKFGMGEDDFAGSGGGSSYTRSGPSMPSLNYQNTAARPKASITGLSLSDGKGGQIGVAGDDVFGMIHSRYQEQRKQSQFHENINGTSSGKP